MKERIGPGPYKRGSAKGIAGVLQEIKMEKTSWFVLVVCTAICLIAEACVYLAFGESLVFEIVGTILVCSGQCGAALCIGVADTAFGIRMSVALCIVSVVMFMLVVIANIASSI